MSTVLVVEDEFAIQEMLSIFLKSEGFEVVCAYDYSEAGAYLSLNQPVDLVLLDWMLPKGSGLQLLKELKSHSTTRAIPVIMLSARAELEDKLTGLNTGADDYLAKPFSLKELLARIHAVLRRSNPEAEKPAQIVQIEGLFVDISAHRLRIQQKNIDIGRMEFKLLAFLMKHLERVYSRAQLLDCVWGQDNYVDERTVDVAVGRLRKILAPSGHDKMLQTVRGEGYRFSKLSS